MLLNVVYLISIAVAGSVTTAMATHLWINRKIIEPDLSLFLLAGLWVWIVAQIGECIFSLVAVKVVFYKVKLIGIGTVGAAWLGFCRQFLEGKNKNDYRRFILLVAFPVLFILATFIPAFERWVWPEFHIAANNLILESAAGPGYYMFVAYTAVLVAAGFIFVIRSTVRTRTLIFSRMVPFLIAAVFSMGAGAADFALKDQFASYRLLPLALSLSSLTVIYYLRLRYFRSVPLARHVVIESMSDSLIVLSPDHTVVYMNPAAHELFGVPPIMIIGHKLEGALQGLGMIIERLGRLGKQNEVAFFSGNIFDVRLSLIRNRGGRIINKVIVLRDVTELKRAEDNLRRMKEQLELKVDERTAELADINTALKAEIGVRQKAEEELQASLEEKNVLLGELHHRVKNNLQVVSSLLKLQGNYITDPKARELFDISVSRIRSIALVHEKLYRSEDISRTQFSDYLSELVHSVVFSHSSKADGVEVKVEVDPVFLDIDKSILSGLIVNELVINSLKHAFPESTEHGTASARIISVGFTVAKGYYSLTVGDNGRGFPEGFDPRRSSSLGMKIIATLVNQLKGTIEFSSGPGSHVRILFPRGDVDETPGSSETAT